MGEGKHQSSIPGNFRKIWGRKNKGVGVGGVAQISEHKGERKMKQILMFSAATLKCPVTRPGEFELPDICS